MKKFRKVKWNAAHAGLAVFALALAAALASQAHAACDSSKRIVHGEADCLWAKKTNKAFLRGKAEARNTCSEHGTVVAKVDRESASDWTWHLSDGNKRSREGTGHIRDIYCCSDLSHFCKTSELSDDGCLDKFEDSTANETCIEASAEFVGSGRCKITAECKVGMNYYYNETSKTAKLYEIEDLHNCKGTLELGGCD